VVGCCALAALLVVVWLYLQRGVCGAGLMSIIRQHVILLLFWRLQGRRVAQRGALPSDVMREETACTFARCTCMLQMHVLCWDLLLLGPIWVLEQQQHNSLAVWSVAQLLLYLQCGIVSSSVNRSNALQQLHTNQLP
jgi:hypothetical protein